MARFDVNAYVDVQTRINRFWTEYPDGTLVTRLMSPPDDFSVCRYEASAYKHRDDGRPSATGYAFEIAGGGGANATSHEENCETSAIGRALANMGYATTRDDRPSAQEMSKVVNAAATPITAQNGAQRAPQAQEQASPFPGTEKQVNFLRGLAKERGYVGEDGHADLARLRREYQGFTTSQVIDALKVTPNEPATAEQPEPEYGVALKMAGKVAKDWQPMPTDATVAMVGGRIEWYRDRMNGAVNRDELNGIGLLARHDGLQDDELRAVYRTCRDRFDESARIAAGV